MSMRMRGNSSPPSRRRNSNLSEMLSLGSMMGSSSSPVRLQDLPSHSIVPSRWHFFESSPVSLQLYPWHPQPQCRQNTRSGKVRLIRHCIPVSHMEWQQRSSYLHFCFSETFMRLCYDFLYRSSLLSPESLGMDRFCLIGHSKENSFKCFF